MAAPDEGLEVTDQMQNLSMQEKDAYPDLTDDRLRQRLEDLGDDPSQFETLKKLRDLQNKHDIVFTEYLREKQEIEDRYERKVAPLLSQRKAELQQNPIKLFWFRAFEHCEVLRENITDKDAVALKYLTDVTCDTVTKRKETNPGAPPSMPVGSFTLTFRFADNPFFENDVLTKTYIMDEDDFEELSEARGSKVLWKSGKDLTIRTMKKKTKSGRVLIKKEPTDSFFNFFNPPARTMEDGTDMDEAMLEELEDVLDADFELGDCIRSDVIPRALLYYLNIAEASESSEKGSEATTETDSDNNKQQAPNGQMKEGNGDPGNDDDSEDSDDSDPPKPSGLPPAAKTAEECKQQ